MKGLQKCRVEYLETKEWHDMGDGTQVRLIKYVLVTSGWFGTHIDPVKTRLARLEPSEFPLAWHQCKSRDIASLCDNGLHCGNPNDWCWLRRTDSYFSVCDPHGDYSAAEKQKYDTGIQNRQKNFERAVKCRMSLGALSSLSFTISL